MAVKNNNSIRQIDCYSIVVPFALVIALIVFFVVNPEDSKNTIDRMRVFLGDTIGLYYQVLALGSVVCCLYLAFNHRYANIRLGSNDKPIYSNFKWGSMIFTSTMAADILFYSLVEWVLYGGEPHVAEMGKIQNWAPTYTLFHWGPMAWGFYVILAVCFSFMLHIRQRQRQRFSEACRPILGKKVDGLSGKMIDVAALFAIVCATATTFSLATPLLTKALGELFSFTPSIVITIVVLILICLVYTVTVLFGVKGISRLAKFCTYLFIALLSYFLFLGGETIFILETGFVSIGNLLENFIGMATFTDPLRNDSFTQHWTIYYWAYWLVWCVATPFFIAIISKGRTIGNVIRGTFGWGLAGTYMSFIILGNYGLAQQMLHGQDYLAYMAKGGNMYEVILQILHTLPLPVIAISLLIVTMMIFYSTTLDGITYVAANYSYKEIRPEEEPGKGVRALWSVMLILLPIALLFSDSSLYNLQGVTIIAAFPIGILLILIVISFFRDVKRWEKGL